MKVKDVYYRCHDVNEDALFCIYKKGSDILNFYDEKNADHVLKFSHIESCEPELYNSPVMTFKVRENGKVVHVELCEVEL